ncbi:uncharacterized protein V1510DRAFT_395881 [Dipodascopsis tothii]|uniref:uncharacterized protein n=1 Tax=Dipodascopsis tothii TaxID=44089 RepID=UPI0034CE382D
MPLQYVNFGVAGAGRIGARHIEHLAAGRNTRVVAVCTPVEAEQAWAREQVPGVKIYADYDAFVADADVQAVLLATPTKFHAEQFISALEHGKHVFTEKPLSMSPDVAWQMYETAAKHPELKAACAFPRRSAAPFLDAARRVRAGEIGDVLAVRSQSTDQFDFTPFFVNYARVSGGIFVDCTIHDIDCALFVAQKDITAVRAFSTGSATVIPELAEMGDVDNAYALVEFDDGTNMHFMASRTNRHGHHSYTEVIGTLGKIVIYPEVSQHNLVVCNAAGVFRKPPGDHFEQITDAFVVEVASFADWVLRDAAVPFNLKDAAKAVAIADALQRSLRTRQQVLMS